MIHDRGNMENVRILRDEYVHIGVFAFVGLALAGGVLTLALAPLVGMLPVDWQFLLAAIWFAVGGSIAFVVYLVVTSFLDRAKRQHEYEIAPPAPVVQIVERPVSAPVPDKPGVTSGLSPAQNERMGDIDREDWEWFCKQIAATRDWTARRWEGITLRNSNYRITNKDTEGQGEATSYARLIQVLVDAGIIADRSPGQTGRLVVTEPDRMLTLIFSHRRVPQPSQPDRNLT